MTKRTAYEVRTRNSVDPETVGYRHRVLANSPQQAQAKFLASGDFRPEQVHSVIRWTSGKR